MGTDRAACLRSDKLMAGDNESIPNNDLLTAAGYGRDLGPGGSLAMKGPWRASPRTCRR